jgi:hypothetical protein
MFHDFVFPFFPAKFDIHLMFESHHKDIYD